MAVAIGFRVEGRHVHWAVVSEAEADLVLEDSGSFAAPRADTEAPALTYIRQRAERILDQHQPSHGGIKYTEPIARAKGDGPRARARIEGVLLQRMDESGMVTFGGAYNAISPRLGTPSAKQLLEKADLRGLDWTDVPDLIREAVLCAAAALREI